MRNEEQGQTQACEAHLSGCEKIKLSCRAQQSCVSICLCSDLSFIQLLQQHFVSQTACVLGFVAKLFLGNDWMSEAPSSSFWSPFENYKIILINKEYPLHVSLTKLFSPAHLTWIIMNTLISGKHSWWSSVSINIFPVRIAKASLLKINFVCNQTIFDFLLCNWCFN